MKEILIIFGTAAIAIAFVGLFYIQAKQQNLLTAKEGENQYTLTSSFVSEMDENFIRMEDYLYTYFYENDDLTTIETETDEIERFLSKERIASNMEDIISLSDYVQCVWFYTPGENEEFVARTNYQGVSLSQLTSMERQIKLIFDDASENLYIQSAQLEPLTLDGRTFLLWAAPVSNSYCGIWVSIDHLSGLFESWINSAENSTVLIRSVEGDVFYNSGTTLPELLPEDIQWVKYDSAHIGICAYSEAANVTYQIVIETEPVTAGMIMSFDYAWIFILLLITLIGMFVMFQVLIFRPFHALISETDALRSKPPEARVSINEKFTETAKLGLSINSLLDERQRLGKKVYEDSIFQRDIQCQYLQVRIKAHFYMNCLNIIYSMAKTGHTDLVLELSDCMISYLRFVQNDTEKLVLLSDELEHVRNYARIQELRFPGLFEYTEDVSVELYDAMIPPLILQTFIENSVEHGMRHDRKNQVRITALYGERDGMPGISFAVEDNGTGFPVEELAFLAGVPENQKTPENHGIGIINVINRLDLIYGGAAQIRFYNNSEGGAGIEMWIPILDCGCETYTDEEKEIS